MFILGWLIVGGRKDGPTETGKEYIVSPTPTLPLTLTPVETRQRFSDDTGAIYISPTRDEKTEIDQIVDLREKSPIETEEFVVEFDYNENVFVVEFKDTEKEGKEESLNEWVTENGYGEISAEYFKIKK